MGGWKRSCTIFVRQLDGWVFRGFKFKLMGFFAATAVFHLVGLPGFPSILSIDSQVHPLNQPSHLPGPSRSAPHGSRGGGEGATPQRGATVDERH